MNGKRLVQKFASFIFATTSIFLSNWANAVVLYDESINGDLATFDTTTLALVSGVNTVLGSGEFSGGGGLPDTTDFDGFLFSLGSGGLSLESITFSVIASEIILGTSGLITSYDLRNGGHSGTTLTGTNIDVLSSTPTTSMFDTSLPLSDNNIYGFSPSGLFRDGQGGSWDYEIEFVVSDANNVPEPATLALMGLGLAGIGYRRRKAA